jgi:hypothetical protein
LSRNSIKSYFNFDTGLNLKIIYTATICCLVLIWPVYGQNRPEADSVISNAAAVSVDTVNHSIHSPHKATLYSMLLPGLGQAYNKKYWKIPIIYAGFGVFYYIIRFNDKEYKKWREAYYFAVENPDGSDTPINDYYEKYGYDPNILRDQKDFYRRNRDLTYILTGLWYIINVVDAAVDAHLMTWEVDENLSLRLEPEFYQPVLGNYTGGGIKLSLHF